MALTSLLLLLFAIFRRSEQWMRQHILKVGWLLTHNPNTTVVFYYSAFLPGIALREICRWLIAGALNVWAKRSFQLPQQGEIDELQLSPMRFPPRTAAFKRMIIEGAPLMVALAALWLIATDVLEFEYSLLIATGGGVADLSRAIGRLLRQPDFGLWFYLMFTIANTMLPPISQELRKRYRLIAIVILIGAFAIGLASDIEGMAVLGSYGRRLLSSLCLILFATSIINFLMALVLGLIEAGIERMTGHSATFAEGKMITQTRQEALAAQGAGKRDREERRRTGDAPKPEKIIRSIYALPLPIPGPPGKEPVSKPVAAVLNVSPDDLRREPDQKPASVVAGDLSGQMDKSRKFSSRPKRMPDTVARAPVDLTRGRDPASADQPPTEPPPAEPLADIAQEASASAPFSRPFSAPPEDNEGSDDIQEIPSADLGFSRPFSSDQDPPTLAAEDADAGNALGASDKDLRKSAPNVAVNRPKPKTRPVAKPSQLSGQDDIDGDAGELRYEPLDDLEIYDDGEAFEDESS